jgi:hypothetical protein
LEGTLIHEMAHAATNGDHSEEWLNEMARLKAAGAPVADWELEGRPSAGSAAEIDSDIDE